MSLKRDLPGSMAWHIIGRLESSQKHAVGVVSSIVESLWNRFQETENVRR